MIYKILGQKNPSASTLTDLYTVPAGKQAVVSTLSVCNQNDIATFRVSVRPQGQSVSSENYIVFDVSILSNDALFLTVGLTLNENDVISVEASSSDISFSLFGSEIE